MAVVVDIDHETGDLTQYDSTVTDGGDLSVTSAAALAGTGFGLQAVIDDTTSIFGKKSLGGVPASGFLRVRFYYDPNTASFAAGTDWLQLNEFDNSGNVWRLWSKKTGTQYTLQMFRYDDAGYLGDTTTNITDAPHLIEALVKRAATAVSNDGTFQWWVDGVSIESITGIDNFTIFGNLSSFEMGADQMSGAGVSGTIYLDNLIIRDDDVEIGPVGSHKRTLLGVGK